MEGLTRLVSESLARHGFDRPLDYRRLRWSQWFRCESHHSLLFVPSKPGVFALAEEILDAASLPEAESQQPKADFTRRMLAVTQFFEDDDMAFVLDRMLSRQNPMRARLISGRYFIRFVVIEDALQRRSICNALNQWMANSAEKASGIGSHFASSLELTAEEHVGRTLLSANTGSFDAHVETGDSQACPEPSRAGQRPRSAATADITAAAINTSFTAMVPQRDAGAANIHCPSPFPSGF